MNSLSFDMTSSLPGSVFERPLLAPVPPLPHELVQHVLILAAHSLVVTPLGDPIDFPDRQALISLALVSPDNYTALQQFVYINVPHCSFHLAAKRGDLALMDWWRTQSGMLITEHHVARALYEASCSGHLHVLEHWAATYPEEQVDPRRVRAILMDATRHGHEDIVLWWVDKVKFDPNVMHPRVDRLQLVHTAIMADSLPLARYWLADQPLGLKYQNFVVLPGLYKTVKDRSMLEWLSQTIPNFGQILSEVTWHGQPKLSLTDAAQGGHLVVLQWFFDYCRMHAVALDKLFTAHVAEAAVEAGQVSVLQWWVANGLPIHTGSWQVDKVSCVATLSWMVDAGWALEYSEAAVDLADSVVLLNWWLAHRGADKLKYTELAMDRACEEGRLDLLEWWFKQHATLGSLLPLKYSSQSLDLAAESGHLDVLEWWLASDLELKIHTPLTLATRGNHLDVMDWLWDHELYNKGAEEELAIYEAITQRHLEALRWWEAHAWPCDEETIGRICRKLWHEDFALCWTELDEYGLQWFCRNSNMFPLELELRLVKERNDWYSKQYVNDRYCSDEDESVEHSKKDAWQVCVEDEFPLMDTFFS